MKKSHYIENGLYLDTTTGNIYQPKEYCELCKSYHNLTVHHFIEQQKALRDLKSKKVITPNTLTLEYLKENQKCFTVCINCHNDIHYLSQERFYQKYGKDKNQFIKKF